MNNMIFAFWFDSKKTGSMFYGEVIFEHMILGKELTNNNLKMIVSLGDVFTGKAHIDIEPYVLKDEYCTINFENVWFKDWPFVWVVEDIDCEIANAIDRRLKMEFAAYVGLSRIDTENSNERKQFWKHLVRKFSLHNNTIICFHNPDEIGKFSYLETANQHGYIVEYDKEAQDSSIEGSCSLQSSYIKKDSDLKVIDNSAVDVDRDLFSLNFSIRQEIQISGVLIWRSINDIDKIYFNSSGKPNESLVEYPFLTLYHASQGIERIQKAIIELICKKNHILEKEKDNIYNLLMSHSHDKLNNWIEQEMEIKFNPNCRKLINILMNFYNTVRYARYSDKEYKKMISPEYSLLLKLKDKKCSDFNKNIKNNYGKFLGELSNTYFKILCNLCDQLNVYAYELDYNSAATIVYYHGKKAKNLYEELKKKQHAKKEVFYWLIKRAKEYPKYKFAKEKELEFDAELIERHLAEIILNPEDGQDYFDEVDTLYDDLYDHDKTKWKSRLELIEHIIDTE